MDEEKFKTADVSKIKSAFNDSSSFASNVSSKASFVDSAANREMVKANTYNYKGFYGNNYAVGDMFSAMY